MLDDLPPMERRHERKIRRERFRHTDGGMEETIETKDAIVHVDGEYETYEDVAAPILHCGHPHKLGEGVARCEACSKEAKRPALNCQGCSVKCRRCGKSMCLRHTLQGPEKIKAIRYCKRCFRIAQREFEAMANPDKQNPILVNALVGFLKWW